MLPLFLVENKYFQKWIQTIDHSFRFPSRKTLKTTYLDNLINVVKTNHKSLLDNAEWVNLSVDGWSDSVNRSFNGYVVQYIDMDWKIQTIPISFTTFGGILFKCVQLIYYFVCLKSLNILGKHTANNIRIQYDSTLEAFSLTNKVFKIVSDQAANCKTAFSAYKESVDPVEKAQQLLNRRHRADLAIELKKAEDQVLNERQQLLQQEFVDHYEEEIKAMHSTSSTDDISSKKFRRDDLLNDLNNWNDENVETEEFALFEEENMEDTDDDIDPESLNPDVSIDPDDPRHITDMITEIAELDKENEEFSSSTYIFL